MKNIKFFIPIMLLVLIAFNGCELEENPNFLSSTNLFDDVDGAKIALNGVYDGIADYGYMTSEYHHVLNWTSGMYNSNRDANLKDISALRPSPNDKFIANLWAASYRTISRANNVILQLEEKDLGNPDERDKILGQALFLRSQAYFDIVRIWGKAPLITDRIDSENPSQPLADSESLFLQVIEDGERAATLLGEPGEMDAGRPSKYAANMLMAKVYMWLAGEQTASETDNWQKAYGHANQVYGKFQLMDHFNDLWEPGSRNNNVESIFEIQGNVENPMRLYKYWTASNANIGRATWARFKPNLEVYDRHVARYPSDPRISYSFITEFNKYKANGTFTPTICYPNFTERNNKDKSYPYGYKYYLRNEQAVNTDTDMNYVVYRYADLLLMLSEIENELNGPDNAYQYVNEVLTRARNSSDTLVLHPANWEGMDQENFRQAVSAEYFYETQQEGQDFFNVRRRGYDFFKHVVINPHNNHPLYDFSKARDLEFEDNSRIMVLPIPELEINANALITEADQNEGY